jgi:hypothetical protein
MSQADDFRAFSKPERKAEACPKKDWRIGVEAAVMAPVDPIPGPVAVEAYEASHDSPKPRIPGC